MDMTHQLLKQVEHEHNELNRRLDEEATEHRKLTALLTHQQTTISALVLVLSTILALWLMMNGKRRIIFYYSTLSQL
jgi:hypothetical protein